MTQSTNRVAAEAAAAPSIANAHVATSTTSAELIAARAGRAWVIIKNIDASITVYVGTGTVAPSGATGGLPLLAGESVQLDTSAAINGRSASGTPSIAYVEGYY